MSHSRLHSVACSNAHCLSCSSVPRFPLPNDCRYFLTEKRETALVDRTTTFCDPGRGVKSQDRFKGLFILEKQLFPRIIRSLSLFLGPSLDRFIPVPGPVERLLAKDRFPVPLSVPFVADDPNRPL